MPKIIAMILNVLVLFLINSIFHTPTVIKMKKFSPDTIPVTTIRATTVSSTEVKHPKGILHIMYVDTKLVVFNLNSDTIPYLIYAALDFGTGSVPPIVLDNLSKVKELYFKPSFSS